MPFVHLRHRRGNLAKHDPVPRRDDSRTVPIASRDLPQKADVLSSEDPKNTKPFPVVSVDARSPKEELGLFDPVEPRRVFGEEVPDAEVPDVFLNQSERPNPVPQGNAFDADLARKNRRNPFHPAEQKRSGFQDQQRFFELSTFHHSPLP